LFDLQLQFYLIKTNPFNKSSNRFTIELLIVLTALRQAARYFLTLTSFHEIAFFDNSIDYHVAQQIEVRVTVTDTQNEFVANNASAFKSLDF